MTCIRLGVVGLHNHYHAIPFVEELERGIDGLELVAFSDERPKVAQTFADAHPDLEWTTDHDELLGRDDVDGVIVTSYTSAHADHVERAAATGKHVLLDKPISTTMEDADRVVAVSKDVKVMLAYLLRFIPVYQQAKQAVMDGAVGDLRSGIYSIRVPAGFITDHPETDDQGWYADPIKGGGGGFIDHGVHFTDFYRWFFESEPVSVTAAIGTLTNPDLGVEDYGIATYILDNGAIVTVESTWHAPGWYAPLSSPDRCSLSGTEGEIELHYQKSPQMEIQGSFEPWNKRSYVDLTGDDRYERCHRDLLIEFGRCIIEDDEPVPSADDGRRALEMVLAAYEADRLGTRVSFPFRAAAVS